MSLNIPKKISELPSTISLAPTDLFVRVGDGGVTSKLTLLKLQDYLENSDTFVTGGTFNTVTDNIDFVGTNSFPPFSVSLSSLISSVSGDTFVVSGNADIATSQLTFTNTTGGTFNVTNGAALFSDNDINVTGGTYDNNTGCVTFVTNSGTTFDICGFITGLTDTYTSSGTYDNNTAEITFTRTDASTYTVDLSTLDLNDTYVTGGTFNSGTNDIDFVGNSSFSPFSVSLNSFTPQTNLPSCRIVISGTSGIVNTNNATDFLVPYNTVDVNTDPTIFNPNVTGGTGNQGKIQVLQSGRYYFTVRYSSFDLAQTGLPTVNGTVFLRITASKDTSPTGTTGGICVLDQSIVGTSVNGEATVVGSGIIDLVANDYLGVIGFHTGATGGSGSQGFPVTNNTFLNEPSFWMVKIG